MTGKSISRNCEDVISRLNAAEVKAIATDNPLLLEKMNAENEVTRLTILRSSWQNERTIMERNIAVHYPKRIVDCEKAMLETEQDIETVKKAAGEFLIELEGRKCDERPKARELLLTLAKLYSRGATNNPEVNTTKVGSFRGLELYIRAGCYAVEIVVKGIGSYCVSHSATAIPATSQGWKTWMGNPGVKQR